MFISIFAPPANAEPAFFSHDVNPESSLSWGYAQIDFYPASPGNGGFDFGIKAGREPAYEMYVYDQFTSVEHTGLDQWYIKAEMVERYSGRATAVFTEGGGNLGEWLDLWQDWIIELSDEWWNGIAEDQLLRISLAETDGAGGPDLTKVTEYLMRFYAYRGKQDYLVQDEFTGTSGIDIAGRTPAIDRRPSVSTNWRDPFVDESNLDMGEFRVNSNNAEAYQGTGSIHEAMAVIDVEETSFKVATEIDFDTNQAGAGIIGRMQDSSNFWLLAVKNPNVTDPVLGLYKVIAGSHSLVASKTLTGLGPFLNLDWYTMRLSFDGNDIRGEMGFTDTTVAKRAVGNQFVEFTDSAYNTESDAGIWVDGDGPKFRRWSSYYWPIPFKAAIMSTSPVTSTRTDTGYVYTNVYFYEGSNDPDSINGSAGFYVDNDTIDFFDTWDFRVTPIAQSTFIIKFDVVTANANLECRQSGVLKTFGTWYDAFRAEVIIISDVAGNQTGVVDATIGVDDGTGNPIPGSTVTKRITLTANSTGT